MSRRVILAAVLFVSAVVLAPVFDNDFVFDDRSILADGDYLHEPARLPELFVHPTMYVSPVQRDMTRAVDTYRPITLVTFMWDAQLSGRTPWAYHLTNLLAHLACVLLVFLLAERMLGRRRRYAGVAALAFGLAPHAAEAHVWINGRSDVFATLFGLGAVLLWRRALEHRTHATLLHVLASLLFLLGLLSKEVLLLALPALVLFPEPEVEGAPTASVPLAMRLRRSAGFFAVSIVYLGLRTNALSGMRASEGPEQIARATLYLGTLLLEGLSQSVAPTRVWMRMMSDDYGRLPDVAHVGALAIVAAIAAFAIVKRRSWPIGAWAALFFAGVLAPAAIIATMLWPGFGRYLYLPMIAVSLALADGAARLVGSWPALRRVMIAAGCAYALLLAFQLSVVVGDYQSAHSLYGAVIERQPEAAHGYGWMAATLHGEERYEDALPYYSRAVERSRREARYRAGLADSLLRLGRAEEALAVAETALEELGAEGHEWRSALRMSAANALTARDPERTTMHLLACVRDQPESAPCGDALVVSLTRHPARARYRAAVREQLRDPSMSEVAARMRPLLASLPD